MDQQLNTSTSLTIFYVDDDSDDQDFFRSTIKKINEKHHLVTFSCGLDLLYVLQNPPPHPYIIFLDINMPGMSGFEVLESIRNLTSIKRFPVVMLSTTRDKYTLKMTFELGASYFLPKQSTVRELQEALEYTLKINWKTFIANQENFCYKEISVF